MGKVRVAAVSLLPLRSHYLEHQSSLFGNKEHMGKIKHVLGAGLK